jgi:UMF1 family MFS transporter
MRQPKSVWGWALYDWGNSAYSTAVMAGFFPIFFKQYWSEGTDVNQSTFYLGIANFSASLVIVLLAPLLGAMADRCGHRKRYLLRFALLGIVTTSLLPLVGQGDWQWAVLLYVLATVGFSGSISFYDSLLIFVAPSRQLDHISALGYAIGYLGGGLLFAITVGMTLKPELFGLADAAAAVKLAFYLVAIWWGLFTLPLLLWVVEADGRPDNPGTIRLFIDALRELRHTLAEVRKQRMVWLFLLAYWCYIDGVDTIIRMAVDYGLALGFSSDSLIIALLITQFVGFPAALLFGRIGTIRGPKFGIQVAITSYILIIIYAYFMDSEFDFYMMAIAIGLVQGGIQSLSRSLYTRLIPREKSAEFFGFYNVLGKFAALLGPLLIGWISLISHDSRLSILSLIPLFVVGAWLLTKVELEHH